jgi:hypothetical protein
MEIIYTLQELKVIPIKQARFKPSIMKHEITVKVIGDKVDILMPYSESYRGFTLCSGDFADFTALINRINEQINGEGA